MSNLLKLPGTKGPSKRVVRQLKMAYPECKSAPDEGGIRTPLCEAKGGRWWENCPHDPYHGAETEYVKTPVVEIDAEGDQVVSGYKTKVLYSHRVNIKGVAHTVQINDGKSVERNIAQRGYKYLQDVAPTEADGSVKLDASGNEYTGYHPMCQFYNCHLPADSRFVSRYGEYCSHDHAALIQLVETETPRWVNQGEDSGRARKQVDDVVLAR